MLAAHVLCQVEREAVGVVQLERGFAVEYLAALIRHLSQIGLEYRHAVLDGGEETLLFLSEYLHHAHLRGGQFGIGTAHLGDQIGNHPVEERGARAELVAVADRAADDAAQHIAAPFVAGDHAIGDQE